MLLMIHPAYCQLALDNATCLQILRESGILRGSGIGVVNFNRVPDGLNAAELEKFLRENGARLA